MSPHQTTTPTGCVLRAAVVAVGACFCLALTWLGSLVGAAGAMVPLHSVQTSCSTLLMRLEGCHPQGNLLHATQTSAMSDDPRHLTTDNGDEGMMRGPPDAPLQRGTSTVIPGSRAGWARAHRCLKDTSVMSAA
jgi:hypothetical protein